MKKTISVFLAALLLLTVLPLAAQADLEDFGTCGDGVMWSFDSESGELLITGSGPMEEFYYPSPFCDFSEIRTLTIGDGVTSIGSNAFQNCTGLTSVSLPDSLKSIGFNAFLGCENLAEVTLPDGLIGIGGYAFSGCSSLISVTIPDSVIDIDSNVFEFCTALTTVTIGSGVSCIPDETFLGCSVLDDVAIPDTVTEIGPSAFAECSALETVSLPDSVETIGSNAFYNCGTLADVTLGANVTSIGSGAFSGCISLGSITISGSVSAIEDSVFFNCGMLESVTIGNGVPYIGANMFYGCTSLASITIPKSVLTIGASAFEGCDLLSEIHYGGSAAEWTDIVVDEGNDILNSVDIHFNEQHTHIGGDPSVGQTFPATCTTPYGYVSVICCTICGEELSSETISEGDPLGHDFGEWSVTTAPTCTKAGEEQRGCSRCEKTETRTIAALGHTPGEAVREKETPASCETAGSYDEVVYCTACGEELSRTAKEIAAPGHTPGEAVREKETPATCETAASYEAVTYCAACGDELTRKTVSEGDPLGHDWDDGEVTLAPTCSATGILTCTCKRTGCGQKTEQELKRDPDAHVLREEVVAPTCVDQGYTLHACRFCRYGYTDTYVGALGHSFTKYSSNQDATCTADGTQTATCDRCTETDTRVDKGSALGHAPGKPVRENDRAASCEKNGGYDEVTYCSRCKNEVRRTTVTLNKLGHVDAGNDGKCDRCGKQITGGSHCSYCGQIHGGTFGWLIRFYHSILAFFKR